jgi:hypothetical protein
MKIGFQSALGGIIAVAMCGQTGGQKQAEGGSSGGVFSPNSRLVMAGLSVLMTGGNEFILRP